jgi:sugar/nucleoside kinase (ribokinase family)
VVITLGDQGLVWHNHAGEHGRLPAYDVETIDTTGAGDSFHGAFAVGVAAGWEWPTIIEYASATAALCCTRMGARHGIPTAREVKAFLDSSPPLARTAKALGITMVLDAGHVRQGTTELLELVDYAVCSATFARDYTGLDDPEQAAAALVEHAPHVVITLGDQGLVWHNHAGEHGRLPAYDVETIDTTGAGDSFHGAFAAGVAAGWDWPVILEYASATAALCCTRIGGRHGIPTAQEVKAFLDRSPPLDVTRI